MVANDIYYVDLNTYNDISKRFFEMIYENGDEGVYVFRFEPTEDDKKRGREISDYLDNLRAFEEASRDVSIRVK